MSAEVQAEIDELFGHLEHAIRLEEYEGHQFLDMVADLIVDNQKLATALLKHASEFIESAQCSAEATWTDILVESYRRALFDAELSPKYGTDWLVKNIPAMRQFVNDYIANCTMGDEGHAATTSVQ